MKKRWVQVLAVIAIAMGVAQFVGPHPSDVPIDRNRTIQSALGPESPLPAVLDRACADCHSNHTVSAWYTKVAPLSWLMARSVSEGRKAVNFSEWAGYPPDVQRTLLSASCEDATSGKMPGPYTLFRPDAKLSAQDIETICTRARR